MMDEYDFRELIATLNDLGIGNAHTKLGGMELIAKEIRDGFQALDKRFLDIYEELMEIHVALDNLRWKE